jgi:ABC-type transport system substrate-binding protein
MSKKLGLFLFMVLLLTLLPTAALAQGDGTSYTIQADDWLSKIAEKEYGDVLAYPAIVEFTNKMAETDSTFTAITDPDLIEVGQVVYLPTAEEAAAFLGTEAGAQARVTAQTRSVADCSYGGLIKSIEAVDDLTVKFTLCSPDVAFPSKVAFTAFNIHPSEYLDATSGTGDMLDKPIGTGPYELVNWTRGDSITFKKNEAYWGEPAKTDTLVFRWSSEGAQRLLELQAGAVDGIDNPTPDDFAVIEADGSLTLYPRPSLNVFYVGMNNWHAPFDNELVRQAIAVGIDRKRIVDNFYPVGSEVASHFTPCAIPGGCEGAAWPAYDPGKSQSTAGRSRLPRWL